MNKINHSANLLIGILSFILILLNGCFFDKEEEKINFVFGEFPDTVNSLTDINSQYDDYNVGMLTGDGPVIFSSNRLSSGAQFDINQGYLGFIFDQKTGFFQYESGISSDQHLSRLIAVATTPRNDFGPVRFFNSGDGLEYMVLASENTDGNLDLKYMRNMPHYGNALPEIEGPFPVNLLNTSFNEGYLSMDANLDSAYYCSDQSGDFDIYVISRPADKSLKDWFNQGYTAGTEVDSLNSNSDDKCPMILKDLIVFTSDRPGGMGGFDLYYSVFRNGKWSAPVNFGPGINSSSNEYRPYIGYHSEFSNKMLIFSSDRPGGKGGYDLYFTGFDLDD